MLFPGGCFYFVQSCVSCVVFVFTFHFLDILAHLSLIQSVFVFKAGFLRRLLPQWWFPAVSLEGACGFTLLCFSLLYSLILVCSF